MLLSVMMGCCTMLLAVTGIFTPARNLRDMILCRVLVERTLIKHSRWDEVSGEPVNVFAAEIVRRDKNYWEQS